MKNANWWTSDQAAEHAACSRKTIVRAARAGRLRHVRLAGNRRLRFRPAWIDEWLMLADQSDRRSGVSSGKQAGNVGPAVESGPTVKAM